MHNARLSGPFDTPVGPIIRVNVGDDSFYIELDSDVGQDGDDFGDDNTEPGRNSTTGRFEKGHIPWNKGMGKAGYSEHVPQGRSREKVGSPSLPGHISEPQSPVGMPQGQPVQGNQKSFGGRAGWENLSGSYRARLERGGVTKSSYEQGANLSKARGHGGK